MKQTIKKSIIGGITFFLTVLILFVAYATFTFDQPDIVGTGSGLTATNWNKIVNSIGYLKSKIDYLENIEIWQIPTLANGRSIFGGGYSIPGYFKDKNNIVHIKGIVKNGTLGTCIFTLPTGYKPLETLVFTNITNNGVSYVIGRLDIQNNGCISQNGLGGTSWASLDGITFRAEQ